MVRQYERVRQISTGRFGATMLVKMSGRLAVMKTVDVSRLRDPAMSGQVVQEVAALAQLRHPHIVAVVECFLEGGVVCIVAEYSEAGHVAARIEKARISSAELKEELILQWFTQATLAVKYTHDRAWLHRDLRARRLLLSPHGHVQLSGLALSAVMARTLAPEAPDLEALRYVSPELVVAAGEHSCASDMWALGVVLFELLALKPPFEHAHPRGLAERLLVGKAPAPPSRSMPQLRRLCTALLRREPASRPTASDVLSDPFMQAQLRALLNAGTTKPPNSSIAPRVPALAPVSPGGPSPPQQVCPLLTTPGRKCLTGPLVSATPTATPRALRQIGEVCSRQPPTARVLLKSKALEPKGMREAFAKTVERQAPKWAVPFEALPVEAGRAERAAAWTSLTARASPHATAAACEERREEPLEFRGRAALDRDCSASRC